MGRGWRKEDQGQLCLIGSGLGTEIPLVSCWVQVEVNHNHDHVAAAQGHHQVKHHLHLGAATGSLGGAATGSLGGGGARGGCTHRGCELHPLVGAGAGLGVSTAQRGQGGGTGL